MVSRKQEMLDILKDYGRNRISPGVVARVLGMMAQTCSGLPDNFPYLVSFIIVPVLHTHFINVMFLIIILVSVSYSTNLGSSLTNCFNIF